MSSQLPRPAPSTPGRALAPSDAAAEETLAAIRERGTHRRMRVLDGAQAARMRVDGCEVLLFAGSNYLDLAQHPEVTEAAARAAEELKTLRLGDTQVMYVNLNEKNVFTGCRLNEPDITGSVTGPRDTREFGDLFYRIQ